MTLALLAVALAAGVTVVQRSPDHQAHAAQLVGPAVAWCAEHAQAASASVSRFLGGLGRSSSGSVLTEQREAACRLSGNVS